MLVSDFVYISCHNTQEVVKKTFWSYTGIKWHSCSLDAKEYKLWVTSWDHPVQPLSRMLAANHVFPQTSDLKKFGLLCVFALIPHLPLLPWFSFKQSTTAHSPWISSLAVAAWPPSRTPSLFPPAAPISLSAVCITSLLCSLQQNPLLWPGAAHMAVLVLQSPLFWRPFLPSQAAMCLVQTQRARVQHKVNCQAWVIKICYKSGKINLVCCLSCIYCPRWGCLCLFIKRHLYFSILKRRQ